jgi:pimeloyl-ACP methyl ester carboxylesterase
VLRNRLYGVNRIYIYPVGLLGFVPQPNLRLPTTKLDELIDILAGPPQDRCSTRAFIALFKASIGAELSPSAKTLLPNLTIPMLLIWGEKDRFIPPKLASEFAKYNDKLEVLYLQEVGHCPHDESPELVNQVILGWIAHNCPE